MAFPDLSNIAENLIRSGADVNVEIIGDALLVQGDCLKIQPLLKTSGICHAITDPPYEDIMHSSKNKRGPKRNDGGAKLKGLNFQPINEIRSHVVAQSADIVDGWCIFFCTPEGVKAWADEINPSPMKYKRACVWVKPDSTPQLNGQGPAMGAEMFVAAWAGGGYAKWNAGGKRGVYTHNVNGRTRHGVHPTEKPISLMCELIGDFTNVGETILDGFMGSGTTGVSALKLGRRFIGIEQDPEYFQIACERVHESWKNKPLLFEPAPRARQQSINFDETAETQTCAS